MFEQLENDLNKELIGTNILTSNFKLLDENSKKSSSYNDKKYIPFYYHLGKYIKPINMLEIGIDLGFTSSCFLKSCKTVEYVLGFQPKANIYWNKNFYISNIKKNYKKKIDFYYGDFLDRNFIDLLDIKKFDIAIINIKDNYDKLFTLCDLIYLNLNKEGYIVIDFIKNKKNEEIFFNIANGYKKEYKVFSTRYGTGVIKK